MLSNYFSDMFSQQNKRRLINKDNAHLWLKRKRINIKEILDKAGFEYHDKSDEKLVYFYLDSKERDKLNNKPVRLVIKCYVIEVRENTIQSVGMHYEPGWYSRVTVYLE